MTDYCPYCDNTDRMLALCPDGEQRPTACVCLLYATLAQYKLENERLRAELRDHITICQPTEEF